MEFIFLHRKLVLKVKAVFWKNAEYFSEIIQCGSYLALIKNFSKQVGVKLSVNSFHFSSLLLFSLRI